VFVTASAAMLTTWMAAVSPAPGQVIIIESSPQHEETVVAPRRLVLRFNTRLEKRQCAVSVVGPGRTTILLLRQDADAPSDTLVFPLPVLGPGPYRATWKVPASDGRVTEGAITFVVREAARRAFALRW
jgi:methionine-rich copper-binding protein CopC